MSDKNILQLTEEDALWLKELEKLTSDQLSNIGFSVETMAEQLHLSRRQLTRKVKRFTGLSPAAYLKEVRLSHARTLIEEKSISSVKELAHKVGISNPDYFGQQYKERFGKLPSDYL